MILPEDVSYTLHQRYVTIPRESLPEEFIESPGAVLANLAEEYRHKINKIDHKLVDIHQDWAVRIVLNADDSIPVTEAGVVQNERWVEFRGTVARIRQPQPRALELAWICKKCHTITKTEPGAKPGICSCGSRHFEYSESHSKFVDTQNIMLSEYFEEVRGARPPRLLDCRLDGTLIQSLNPGDRCVVGGVMRLRPTKVGYEYELVANNVMQFRPAKEVEAPDIQGDVIKTLVDSFAPNVHGYHTIKESILLLLVGGSVAIDGRTNINILLVGDPGIAKSTLLKEAAAAAPLGRYTSGRGSTAAGLTAGMARDKDGVMYMEAGAAVLTDTGVLCLDELDKMTKPDRAALHEVMEQQTASIAKLGVMITMNARVAVLAAANPKKSFWDDNLPLADNIDLPESLLTRFDLMYNLRDVPDIENDRKIAAHILGKTDHNVLDVESITAYIASVRPLRPVLSADAAESIQQYYVRARADPGELRITPRQLEAVQRLSGARAKLCRRKEISKEDATRAIYLVENMIQDVMVDPETGKPDHMKAISGESRTPTRRVEEALGDMEGDFTAADVADVTKISIPETERALERLHQSGIVLERRPGIYNRI